MSRYIVLIGDIENSKQLEPDRRSEIQQTLAALFERMNTSSGSLAVPFTFTLGDEFQALYQSGDELFSHLWKIMAGVHPVMIRFSIGAGEISTPISTESTRGMDGPVFYKAREGMEKLKKGTGLFHLSSGYLRADQLFNNVFLLLTQTFRSWNSNRFFILQHLDEGKEVKEIAEIMNLSEVAVYKNIKAGNLNVLRNLAGNFSEVIDDIVKK